MCWNSCIAHCIAFFAFMSSILHRRNLLIHWHCSTFRLKSRWRSLWSLLWRIRSAESRNLSCHVCPHIVTDFCRTQAHSRKIAGTGHVAIRRLASWHDAFIEPWIVWIVMILYMIYVILIYFAHLYFHNVPFHQLQCEPESTLWFWQPKSFYCLQDGQQKLFLVADLAEIMLVQHESDWGIWCCEGRHFLPCNDEATEEEKIGTKEPTRLCPYKYTDGQKSHQKEHGLLPRE